MLSSNLKVYRALTNGRKSPTVINTGVVENVFPHVTSAQRKSGYTDYAKTFWGLDNSDNYPLLDPESYQDKPTLSPYDYVVMWESSQRALPDQASLATAAAAATKYGSAVLAADITAGAFTLQVTVKAVAQLPGGADSIFRANGKIKICSHSTAIATDGEELIRTINGNTPTYSGLTVTMTVTEAITPGFTVAAGTRVSSLIKPVSSIAPSYGTITKTSAGGVVDDTTYPILLDNKGTIEEDWSIDWSDATNFTMSGDSRTETWSGIVGTDFIPVDTITGRPLMTVPAAMLSGTWTAGDKLELTTHPAALPIGQKRVVLPNALSLANNKVTQVLGGEAAG